MCNLTIREYSKCCNIGNWTCFSFAKTFHLLSSPVLTNWRGVGSWIGSFRGFEKGPIWVATGFKSSPDSFFFCSSFVGMVSAQRFRVQLTLSLCSLNLAHERIPQHTRANSTGQDSAVHLHLKGKSHSFEDNNENILAREDRWFERGVKESICQTGTTVLEQEVAQEITYHPLTMLN